MEQNTYAMRTMIDGMGFNIGKGAKSIIEDDLKSKLDKCGIMYRIFSRCKNDVSVIKKLKSKGEGYYSKEEGGKKIRDIVGLRIVFYFISDIKPFCEALKSDESLFEVSDSENEFKSQFDKCRECNKTKCKDCKDYKDSQVIWRIGFDELFSPVRLNLVFKMSDEVRKAFANDLTEVPEDVKDVIDSTYEVQLRSVLSEGWHEVEHDLRYKFKTDWTGHESESRLLNGIYASLESNENAMEMLFERKARSHYRAGQWEAMLRNHLRLRLADSRLSDDIARIFDTDRNAAKPFLREGRENLIKILFSQNHKYEVSYNNLVYLINRMQKRPNEEIIGLEPERIKEIMDSIFKVKE